MKRDVKLYNVMFPLWMFFLLPTVVWLIILPVNFAVDTLVVLLVLGRLEGVREGTVISALLVGKVIGILQKWIKPAVERICFPNG